MKLLLVFCLLSAGSFAQLRNGFPDSIMNRLAPFDDIVPSFSLDYHYQGFHGLEAAMHITNYSGLKTHCEYGVFFGSDFNFNNGFGVVAPTFGLETNFLFVKARGTGFSAKLHGTIYYRGATAYLIFAPEIAFSYMSIVDFFYSWNYSMHSFDNWQPHRVGIRFTFGYERTIYNVFDMIDRS